MRRLLFITTILCSSSVFAESPNIVITPTRSETSLEQIGSSVTVISGEEIKNRQKENIADLLAEVPGIDVAKTGAVGQTTTLFTRSTNPEHTLVLLDGVAVNDPTSTAGNYDFSRISTDNIERIEILRGNQSTLYGSNAIGGVINIISKKGTAKPHIWTSLQGGSYKTYKAASGVSGRVDNIGFNIDASRFTTAGFSSFNKNKGGSGHDGSDYSNFDTRLDAAINDIFAAYTTMRYNNSRAEFDEFGAEAEDATHAKELSWRGAGKADLFNGRWKQELGVSYYKLDRDTTDIYTADQFYRGDRFGIDWVNNVKVDERNYATFGAETKYETARNTYLTDKQDQRTNGYFVQDQIKLAPRLFTTLGVRIDDNSAFGTKDTYRIAQVYTTEQTDTELKASYGTGFKTPSLFQLYSSYGNPNLSPENSTGYDFGFEQPLLKDKVRFGSTFFHTLLGDLIDYDFATSKYFNVGKAKINGLENFIKWSPTKSLDLKLQYTYSDAYSVNTHKDLLRRAKHKAAFNADYSFLEKGKVGLNTLYNGSRDDINFSYDRTTMPSNLVLNLTSSWKFNDNLQVFGRIDNLLDRRYESVYGYGTSGLAAYAGVKASY